MTFQSFCEQHCQGEKNHFVKGRHSRARDTKPIKIELTNKRGKRLELKDIIFSVNWSLEWKLHKLFAAQSFAEKNFQFD